MLGILLILPITCLIFIFVSDFNDKEEMENYWLEHEKERGKGYKICAYILSTVIGLPATMLLIFAFFIWLFSSIASKEAVAKGEECFYWGVFLYIVVICLRQWVLPWIDDKLGE
jgi:hypothetical protein